jgi:hypothetical protein
MSKQVKQTKVILRNLKKREFPPEIENSERKLLDEEISKIISENANETENINENKNDSENTDIVEENKSDLENTEENKNDSEKIDIIEENVKNSWELAPKIQTQNIHGLQFKNSSGDNKILIARLKQQITGLQQENLSLLAIKPTKKTTEQLEIQRALIEYNSRIHNTDKYLNILLHKQRVEKLKRRDRAIKK